MKSFIIKYLLEFCSSDSINYLIKNINKDIYYFRNTIISMYKTSIEYCLEYINLINKYNKNIEFRIINYFNKELIISINNIINIRIIFPNKYNYSQKLSHELIFHNNYKSPSIRQDNIIKKDSIMRILCYDLYDFTF